MFDWFNSLLKLGAGLSGLGVLSWIALAIFAPSVLQVVSSFLVSLSPLVKGFAEAVVEIVKRLWEGMKDMMDNFSSILFVVTVACIAFFSAYNTSKIDANSCKPVIDQLRKDYTFVPKRKTR